MSKMTHLLCVFLPRIYRLGEAYGVHMYRCLVIYLVGFSRNYMGE